MQLRSPVFTGIAFLAIQCPLHATVLAYEGFFVGAGGYTSTGGYVSPTPGPSNALVWDADSTAGGSVGQSPVVAGFASAGWTQAAGTNQSSSVYPRVQSTQQLSYTRSSRQLTTTAGEVSVFRSSSSGGSKVFTRNLNVGPSTSYSTVYYSGLFQFTSAINTGLIQSGSWNSTDSSDSHTFGMTFAADGSVTLGGDGATAASTAAGAIVAAQTYFFVWKVEDLAEGDKITLYLNPVDLSGEAGNSQTLATSGAGDFLDTGDANYSLRNLQFGSTIANGNQMLVDEFRIGTTWSDVVPFTTVPEPGTTMLVLVGGCLGAFARRRSSREG